MSNINGYTTQRKVWLYWGIKGKQKDQWIYNVGDWLEIRYQLRHTGNWDGRPCVGTSARGWLNYQLGNELGILCGDISLSWLGNYLGFPVQCKIFGLCFVCTCLKYVWNDDPAKWICYAFRGCNVMRCDDDYYMQGTKWISAGEGKDVPGNCFVVLIGEVTWSDFPYVRLWTL